ncbi:MAG TPA: branched-chain amino acid ABC transporter permease [Bacillota bacterium]|nr:branched-chain amino acid ABC transporter permease [Bacillota bacterium]HOH09855.1 branched-chain amino acid ABC transporter permease [Bacillota bacterium]HOY88222.1 branched-chain amino acid ABC transporter permease [Bacillota bacterium]HPI00732.1 branched-chain amino acid ABC transporter permease [Bacillota bacterium]HPM64235.1 branched-chain amino acid ABC transporter permease [Bacillota bacterium]
MNPFQVLIQTIVNGLLLGSIIALVAIGIAIIRGVMDMVNFAQGEFLMLGMYASYWINVKWNLDPLVSAPITIALMFILGVIVYKVLIARVIEAPMLAQMLLTFGLSIVLVNVGLFLWGSQFKTIPNVLVKGTISIGGVMVSLNALVPALVSLLMAGAVYWFLMKTRMGRAFQATSMNKKAAALVGIDTQTVYALAFGLAAACAGLAGSVLSISYYIFPGVGSVFNLYAFVAVCLGGFGSIPGAFIGGLMIGVSDSLAGFYISAAFKYVVAFGIYLVTVIFKPKGLFGW